MMNSLVKLYLRVFEHILCFYLIHCKIEINEYIDKLIINACTMTSVLVSKIIDINISNSSNSVSENNEIINYK